MNTIPAAAHREIASLFTLAGPECIAAVLSTAFLIWMVVDCVNYEADAGNRKAKWLLIILLVPLGSLFYCLKRRGFNRIQSPAAPMKECNKLSVGTVFAVIAVIAWMILIVVLDLGIVHS